jgi:tetratricopeptide (TPR) repeat protein
MLVKNNNSGGRVMADDNRKKDDKEIAKDLLLAMDFALHSTVSKSEAERGGEAFRNETERRAAIFLSLDALLVIHERGHYLLKGVEEIKRSRQETRKKLIQQPEPELKQLAENFYDTDNYDQSANIYDVLVDKTNDKHTRRRYLEHVCYYYSGLDQHNRSMYFRFQQLINPRVKKNIDDMTNKQKSNLVIQVCDVLINPIPRDQEHSDVNKKLLYRKTWHLFRFGRYRESIACAEELLSINDESPWNEKAKSLKIKSLKLLIDQQEKSQQYDPAIALYDELIDCSQSLDLAIVFVQKGCVLLSMKRYQCAFTCFSNAVKETKAATVQQRFQQTVALCEAIQKYSGLDNINKDRNPFSLLARRYFDARQYQQAGYVFGWMAQCTQTPSNFYNQGLCLVKMRQYSLAAIHFKTALMLDNADKPAKQGLKHSLTRLFSRYKDMHPRAAVRCLYELISLFPKDQDYQDKTAAYVAQIKCAF